MPIGLCAHVPADKCQRTAQLQRATALREGRAGGGFKVVRGNEACFEFDHRDPTTKWVKKKGSSCKGVSGLCNSLCPSENPETSPGRGE